MIWIYTVSVLEKVSLSVSRFFKNRYRCWYRDTFKATIAIRFSVMNNLAHRVYKTRFLS